MSLHVDSRVRGRLQAYPGNPVDSDRDEQDITDKVKARRADTSVRNASIQQKLREAGLQENGRYIILYAKRPVQLLKSLRSAWDEGDAIRHAETTGMLLGQLAYAPQLAVEMLPLTMDFMEKYGPQGVDGVFLSCLSAAEVLDVPLYEKSIAFAEMYSGMGAPPFGHHTQLNNLGRDLEGLLKGHGASMLQGPPSFKDGMGIFVGDLAGPARQFIGIRGSLTGDFLLTGFADRLRPSLFNSDFLGTGNNFFGMVASGSGALGQNLRGGVRDGDSQLFLSSGSSSRLLIASCEGWVKFFGTVGGGIVGGIVGGKIGIAAGFGGGAALGHLFADGTNEVFCGALGYVRGDGKEGDTSGGDTSGGDTPDSGGTCEPGDEHSATPVPDGSGQGGLDGGTGIFTLARNAFENQQRTTSLKDQYIKSVMVAEATYAIQLDPLIIYHAETMSSSLARADVGRLSADGGRLSAFECGMGAQNDWADRAFGTGHSGHIGSYTTNPNRMTRHR